MFFSPLAQFDIIEYIPFYLGSFDISISNGVFSIFIIIFIYLFIFNFLKLESYIIPTYLQLFLEQIYLFILKIVIQQIGYKGLKFFPFIITIFLFILSLNLLSMLPFSFAMTTHIIWTLTFTISLLLGLVFLGFYRHNINFLKMFVPDVPVFLYVLMIPIEVGSYIIRAFSLGIRLSANILAGHTLLHIIVDMSQSISFFNFDFSYFCILLLCGILVMELGVACLQAYIFSLLVSIYINDVYHLSGH